MGVGGGSMVSVLAYFSQRAGVTMNLDKFHMLDQKTASRAK